jgi:hypothetical protein
MPVLSQYMGVSGVALYEQSASDVASINLDPKGEKLARDLLMG